MSVPFRLPMLATGDFIALMKAGVSYKSGVGFTVSSKTDQEQAFRIISSYVHQPVELAKTCFLCSQPLAEEATLCSECLKLPDVMNLYQLRFAQLAQMIKDEGQLHKSNKRKSKERNTIAS